MGELWLQRALEKGLAWGCEADCLADWVAVAIPELALLWVAVIAGLGGGTPMQRDDLGLTGFFGQCSLRGGWLKNRGLFFLDFVRLHTLSYRVFLFELSPKPTSPYPTLPTAIFIIIGIVGRLSTNH